jgi:7-cyano-7-deazaguanine tRNA-ribosyltransferase
MKRSGPESPECFRVHSKDLLGRVGTIVTKSGEFPTPHMFPVVDPNRTPFGQQYFNELGIHAIMTNAYLHRRARVARPVENVHDTLGFKETVATDSGAYQILQYGGVEVKPAEIVKYQEEINTDIGVILDIPTGFRSDPDRSEWTVTETIKRSDEALRVRKRDDILWVGPVQGGVYLEQVTRSAREMALRDFSIYALGSPTELMESQRFEVLVDMIIAAKRELPPGKPLHLFGAGHPAMFPFFVALGCDLFDSAAYALYARSNRYLTSEGTLELFEMEEFPCSCSACSGWTPKEARGLDPAGLEGFLTRHNLQACFSELRRVREAIRNGRLWDLLENRAHTHPALKRCLSRIADYSEDMERSSPVVKPHGIFYFGSVTNNRPEMVGYATRLARVQASSGSIVLLLPGRWRRPYRADPRYRSIVAEFEDRPRVQVVYYTIPFGPVPSELDETYPIAQTEGLDTGDHREHEAKAKIVAEYLKRLRPRMTVIVSEGDFGKAVMIEARKVLPRSRMRLADGQRIKTEALAAIFRRTFEASVNA